jgi:hypothetical protein
MIAMQMTSPDVSRRPTPTRSTAAVDLPVEDHMRQISFTASVLVSFLRSGISALVTFLGPSWDGPDRK